MEMSIRFPELNLVLSYVPRSFQIFGMEFTIYGVLIAIGALLGEEISAEFWILEMAGMLFMAVCWRDFSLQQYFAGLPR